jgi:hypothetical protein
MDIDYLSEFEELQQKDTFRGQQWFGERQRLVNKYSWAVPTERAVRYISAFEMALEVGAGTGYWAHLVEQAGGHVRATDIDPPDNTYVPVHEAPSASLGEEIRDGVVLLVWPPHDTCMASTILSYEPNHVLYVGETRGGCTADAEFFDTLDRLYGLVGKIEIPSYAGINDNFFHYGRNI